MAYILVAVGALALGLVLGAVADWRLLLQVLRGLRSAARTPAEPVAPGMSRMELDLAAGDPELAALARGPHQT
jgi:hypothetical protein